ncbi:MAG: hypothetical protein ILO64_02040, partial [Clostridia bacterium]|nr:hypothetical protein [Clostridia bacterium]
MKKLLVIVLALAMLATLAACGTKDVPAITYAEYAAAAIDREVVIETYVQAKQGWWEKEGVGGVG